MFVEQPQIHQVFYLYNEMCMTPWMTLRSLSLESNPLSKLSNEAELDFGHLGDHASTPKYNINLDTLGTVWK